MVVAFATPFWENISYDKNKVLAAVEANSDYTVEFPQSGSAAGPDGYFTLTNLAALRATTVAPRLTGGETTGSGTDTGGGGLVINGTTIPAVLHIPKQIHGGLWSTCDTIPDDLRDELTRQNSGSLHPKCMSHLRYTLEELKNNVKLDMLQSLSRSANACAIVAVITACTALGLGAFAAIKQQIIFAVIAGVCFGAAGLYTLFTVTLMLLRKSEVEEDPKHLIPEVVWAGRVVTVGWAMYLGWISFLLSSASCVLWILMSIELRRARQNYVFSSQYDQICSM